MEIFKWFIWMIMVFQFVTSTDYDMGDPQLAKQFRNLHPKVKSGKSLSWPFAENITDDVLKELCDQVVSDIIGSNTVKLNYSSPEAGKLQTERVLRNSKVYFKEGITKITLLRCAYQMLEFYLAPATENFIFRLDMDRRDKFFYFKSGLHKVKEKIPGYLK